MTSVVAAHGARRLPAAALVRAMRPRQWVKNVLVFAVPLAAGELTRVPVLVDTVVAFVAFCLASSSTYLVNDVVDLEADRAHPRKSRRPVASGALPVTWAVTASVVLAVTSVLVAAAVNPRLAALVVLYLLLTTAYSTWLKNAPVVELVVVATGFLLRGVAGGAATGTTVSTWFLLVAGFGSLFLVAGKRASELEASEGSGATRQTIAVYRRSFLTFVWGLAATVTVAGYCLWANAVGQVGDREPWALWSIVPFVLAILLYAFEVDRGTAEAPEDVVLTHGALLACAVAWLVLFSLGAWGV